MKPSERRALQAEKQAQREAEQNEKEIRSGSCECDEADAEKKESFFSRNVRVITFSICVVLILTVLGPWSVDRLVSKHRESIFGSETKNKQDLTAQDIVYLAGLGDSLTWSSFDKYNYTDQTRTIHDEVTGKKRTEYQREYAVDAMLTVKVIGSSSKGRPARVQMIYYGKDAEIIEEIRGKNVTEFLTQHGYLK